VGGQGFELYAGFLSGMPVEMPLCFGAAWQRNLLDRPRRRA